MPTTHRRYWLGKFIKPKAVRDMIPVKKAGLSSAGILPTKLKLSLLKLYSLTVRILINITPN